MWPAEGVSGASQPPALPSFPASAESTAPFPASAQSSAALTFAATASRPATPLAAPS